MLTKKENNTMKTIISLFLMIFIFTKCKQDVKPPQRIKNIPIEALWYGGPDGGCWIKIDSTNIVNEYRVTVFYEGDGSIWSNGLYKLCESCESKNLSLEKIKDLIDGFDGEVIILDIIKNKEYCTLEKVSK